MNKRSRSTVVNAARGSSPDQETFPLSTVLWMARAVLIGTLFYAAWRLGATESIALQHVSASLAVVTFLLGIAVVAFHYRPTCLTSPFFLVAFIFIGYSYIQSKPIPSFFQPYFSHVNQVHNDFGDAARLDIARSLESLIGEKQSVPFATWASTIPQASEWALVPFSLAVLIAWLSANLFHSPMSRRFLLWAILINTALLSAWGIIQRAGGSVDILPGMPNTYAGSPFSSFIYRNAGAAAVLPGFAAGIALLAIFRGSRSPSTRDGYRPTRTYSNPTARWFSARELGVIALMSLVAVGTLVSLSRGAWATGIISVVVVMTLIRRRIQWSRTLLVAIVPLIVAAVGISQVVKPLLNRVDKFSIDEITMDQRMAHWQDGWNTALRYFPSGSGLGTYGYSVLPEQVEPRNGWFREAHNQYLETLVESGLVGIVALATFMTLVIIACRRLLAQSGNSSQTSDHFAWGLAGATLFVFASVHSAVDFVLVIPANLMIYGCLLGVIAKVAKPLPTQSIAKTKGPRLHSTPSQPQNTDLYRMTPPMRRWIGGFYAAATIVLALLTIPFTWSTSRSQVLGDQAISKSSIADLNDPPPKETIRSRIAELEDAIVVQPRRATLYRHKLLWQFALFRHQLIEASSAAGESITWESTQPEMLAQILASLPEEIRTDTISAMVTPPLSTAIVETLHCISQSLQNNPLFVQVHLTGTCLADLLKLPAKDWMLRSAQLSKCDPSKLYVVGLVAHAHRLEEVRDQQWHSCLEISRTFPKTIFTLALQTSSPLQIAKTIIPESKPELMVDLIRNVLTPPASQTAQSKTKLERIAHELVDEVMQGNPLNLGFRHEVAAKICNLASLRDEAADHWLKAVEAEPKNALYRSAAATELLSVSRYDEALHQATLGESLDPTNPTFPQLSARARVGIAKTAP